MTRGADVSSDTYDSSSSDSSSDDPKPYGGGDYHDTGTGTIDTGQAMPLMPTIPGIPRSGYGTDVSVDTMALKKFADNLDTIAEAVGKARDRVDNLQPIRPGTFTEATTLKAKISGGDGGGGLQEGLSLSMHDLRQALMETAEKIRTMADKYSTLEEVNSKAGSELSQLLQSAQSDLQAFQQDSAAVGQSVGGDPSLGM